MQCNAAAAPLCPLASPTGLGNSFFCVESSLLPRPLFILLTFISPFDSWILPRIHVFCRRRKTLIPGIALHYHGHGQVNTNPQRTTTRLPHVLPY